MILKKIRGLWMILTAFIPIIWIVLFINIIIDVYHLINSYLNTFNNAFTEISATLEQSANSINNSVEQIREVQDNLSNVSEKINNIPETIPGFNISVPGIEDLKNMLKNNFNILEGFSDVIDDITVIGKIQGYYQEIVTEVQKSVKTLQIIGIKFLVLIVFAVTMIVPCLIQIFIIPYFRWTQNRIKRGWQLIRS